MRHSSNTRAAAVAGLAVISLATAGCGGPKNESAKSVGAAGVAHANTVDAHHAAGPIFPLTGLKAPSAKAAHRPVLAVKIDNVEGSFPQYGVNSADVVVEEIVEGGLTRLVAAFQSKGASRVGPIRSARPVDADLERLWGGGILAYSGAAPLEIKPSIDHGHAVLENATTYGTPYYRSIGYVSPHNLFSSTDALYRGASVIAGHKKIGSPTAPLFHFGSPSGRKVSHFGLTVSPVASSAWRYSAAHHSYYRWQNGVADMAAGGGQLDATNVVVMQVRLVQTSIVDDAGNHDPLDVVLGKGKAWVFSGGHEATGSWSRPNDASALRLSSGKRLMSVSPGRTWIELLPLGQSPSAG